MTTNPAPVCEDLLAAHEMLLSLEPAVTEAEHIDRIVLLERIKAASEAAQARETAKFDQKRRAEETNRGIPKAQRCKGLGSEIALARAEPPARGKQQLDLARLLTEDLPQTFHALWHGQIREEHAQSLAKEVSGLSPTHRREVDGVLAERLGSMGPRQIAQEARAHAQRLDPNGAAKRQRKAEAERRVVLRPAGNGLSQLSAIGSTQQLVALYSTLRRDANSAVKVGDTKDRHEEPRTRDQLMFDHLIERGTGQSAATNVAAEVILLMTPDTLLAQGDTPAWLAGHGPIPAATAREWLTNEDAAVLLRRLFTDPAGQQLVSLESRARVFPAGLRKLVLLRDNTCRTPYCEAPIQEIDHMTPHRDGGPTTWDNASGLCGACNQTKENRGW